MNKDRAIGAIDVGGTKIAVGVVDADGRILARGEGPTAPEEGYAAALERIEAMLRRAFEESGRNIEGIGIGSTGPIDPETGVYGEVGTLPGWQGSPLAADLERAFGVPVRVENDADAAALGEAAWGAGRGRKSLLYITVSTGIGVGVLLGGRVYRGAGGAHPEIGHQVVDASGPTCYCRANGCWESLASGPAMEAWMEASMRAKGAAARSPAEPLTARRICELARQGDALARQAVERGAHYLGLGLANLVTVFCPETIALGGGLMRSADLLLPGALGVVREICTQVPAERTSIVLASLGQDVGLLGAACVWRYRLGEWQA
ncbi:MAG: ROK family protein [Bryobacteraceae bacterium]